MIDWPRGKDGRLDPPAPESPPGDRTRLRLLRQGWPEHRIEAELGRSRAEAETVGLNGVVIGG